jgi:hypothetical protein
METVIVSETSPNYRTVHWHNSETAIFGVPEGAWKQAKAEEGVPE